MGETVKIDSDLLKRVEAVVRDRSKKIKYSCKKQFINLAVLELLEKEESKNGK